MNKDRNIMMKNPPSPMGPEDFFASISGIKPKVMAKVPVNPRRL